MAGTLDQALAAATRDARALPARWLWVAGMAALVLALPPLIYAGLAWRQAGFLNPSWFVPYEELLAAVDEVSTDTIAAYLREFPITGEGFLVSVGPRAGV